MAAPTETRTHEPHHVIKVSGTDVDAGNNDYVIQFNTGALNHGFSIITGTLTAMTVTIRAENQGNVVDITNDLFNVASLASDTAYIWDNKLPVEKVIIRAVRTNATNAVDFVAFFKAH